MATDWLHRPLTETVEALRRRELSPLELMDATLARIDAVDEKVNAFVARRDGEVLRGEAREAGERIARGEARGRHPLRIDEGLREPQRPLETRRRLLELVQLLELPAEFEQDPGLLRVIVRGAGLLEGPVEIIQVHRVLQTVRPVRRRELESSRSRQPQRWCRT